MQERRPAHDLTVPWAVPDGPSGVTAARRAGREQVRALGVADPEILDAVELIVSELAGNAVKHVGGTATLRVQRLGEVIRVEVCDGETDRVPERRSPDAEGVGGRGLLLVSSLATSWGYDRADGQKCTWAEVEMSRPPTVPRST